MTYDVGQYGLYASSATILTSALPQSILLPQIPKTPYCPITGPYLYSILMMCLYFVMIYTVYSFVPLLCRINLQSFWNLQSVKLLHFYVFCLLHIYTINPKEMHKFLNQYLYLTQILNAIYYYSHTFFWMLFPFVSHVHGLVFNFILLFYQLLGTLNN